MPLLAIGFRPFYLGAALFAAVAVPVWYGGYRGFVTLEPVLPAQAWHAHEMVFGFAPAVIGGFLLTAVRTWTSRPTAAGMPLAALFVLWMAGRMLLLTGPEPYGRLVDVVFLPVLALHLALPLWRSGNWRNLFVVPLLLALGALSAAHHAAWAGVLDSAWATRAWTAGLDLIAVLLAVIGGRVIPAFAANAVPGLRPRSWPTLEWLAIGCLLLVLALDLTGTAAGLPTAWLRGLLLLGAVSHLLRLMAWRPWATVGNGLLVVLPLGYLWLPVHLAVRASSAAPELMDPLAAHALAVGAMAGLMLAMMTRSALGHTGRPLRAGVVELTIFAAIHLSALTRVAGPLLWPVAYPGWLAAAGALWTLAFTMFVLRYAPILCRARVDAHP